MTDARDDMLPEHADNVLTRGLGPPMDWGQSLALLRRGIDRDAAALRLRPHLRRYCVLRLLDWVEPLGPQVDLVERVGMVIRQGYKGRDPARGQHRDALLDAVDRLESNDLHRPGKRFESTAVGFALLGHPGMGKSLTMNRILASYPCVLRPDLPYSLLQVPCLKVECPSKGSDAQFCRAFFVALDNRLGTTSYAKEYGGPRETTDRMLLHVQHLCHLHAIGVLVIDEIQHLNESTTGPKKLMNFLVTLVNLVGVPVVLVGTMAARRIIQQDFREARRATGLGSPVWERLLPGEDWDDFVDRLWEHQWTAVPSALTPEMREVLYQESQGIVDIVVKLFVLAQFRAIALGEVYGAEEALSAGLLKQIARDELKLIRPMIDALRTGRPDALDAYDDLAPLQRHVEAVLASGVNVSVNELRERLTAGAASARAPAGEKASSTVLRSALEGMGIGADVAGRIMAEVEQKHPSGDLFQMLDTARDLAEGTERKRRRTKRASGGRRGHRVAADPLDLRSGARAVDSRTSAGPGAPGPADAHVSTVEDALAP